MSVRGEHQGDLADTLATHGGNGHGSLVVRPRADLLVQIARRLFLVAMFILPWITVRVTTTLSVSDFLFAFAAIALALSVRPPRRAPRTSAWFFAAFLVILSGVLASMASAHAYRSLQVVLNAVYVFVVWQWSSRNLLDRAERTRQAMTAYILGSSISAVVAITQEIGHTTLGLHALPGSTSRAIGLAQQPNIAGITFAVAFLFVLGLLFQGGMGRFSHRVVCLVALGLGLMMTGSVSGMSAVLVGTVVLLLRRGFRVQRLFAIALALTVLYLGGTQLETALGHPELNPFTRVHAATGQNSKYNSVNTRTATYRVAWAGIQQSPVIGHGLDTETAYVYQSPNNGFRYPIHDIFLLVWYEGGILMLFGFALAMGSSMRRTWRGSRDPTKDALFSAMVCVLVFALQSPELLDRWLWLPFVLGMTIRNVGPRVRARSNGAGVLHSSGAALPSA